MATMVLPIGSHVTGILVLKSAGAGILTLVTVSRTMPEQHCVVVFLPFPGWTYKDHLNRLRRLELFVHTFGHLQCFYLRVAPLPDRLGVRIGFVLRIVGQDGIDHE